MAKPLFITTIRRLAPAPRHWINRFKFLDKKQMFDEPLMVILCLADNLETLNLESFRGASFFYTRQLLSTLIIDMNSKKNASTLHFSKLKQFSFNNGYGFTLPRNSDLSIDNSIYPLVIPSLEVLRMSHFTWRGWGPYLAAYAPEDPKLRAIVFQNLRITNPAIVAAETWSKPWLRNVGSIIMQDCEPLSDEVDEPIEGTHYFDTIPTHLPHLPHLEEFEWSHRAPQWGWHPVFHSFGNFENLKILRLHSEALVIPVIVDSLSALFNAELETSTVDTFLPRSLKHLEFTNCNSMIIPVLYTKAISKSDKISLETFKVELTENYAEYAWRFSHDAVTYLKIATTRLEKKGTLLEVYTTRRCQAYNRAILMTPGFRAPLEYAGNAGVNNRSSCNIFVVIVARLIVYGNFRHACGTLPRRPYTMSTSELPTELNVRIAESLVGDSQALSALSQVSKHYRTVAEPFPS
ncbi:hypothetical protein CC80DRAFT_597228 [Byssothecium circinans]|uniref:F-box domain-containing protein n=1 Tax=Byssothecium circinans TaxID=147558 RepID=A0A6A5TS56_9PLEO|nr:hypothetical protein CC80DRAFT_597228 [Byssothecium circinans]